jgi:hypothetical protein
MAGLTDEWVNRSGLAIEFMAQFDLGDAVVLNYSAESLRGLGAVTAQRFTGPAEVLAADNQPQVEGVVAYVGECLARASRGAWHWDESPGFTERYQPAPTDPDLAARLSRHRWRFEDIEATGVPVVRADAVLGLDPVSPLHLLLAQLEWPGPAGDGPWAATLDHWQRAVSAYTADHPQWAAITAPTLTDGMPIMPPSPVLDAWLEERSRDFPRWANTYDGTWDFSPQTVDALSALVFRVTPTVEAFEDPVNADFSETASWYFGELLCRAYPSRWMYRDHWREPGDPLAVCFTVQTNDNRDFTTPFGRISNALRRKEPARLRAAYDVWAQVP